MMRRPTKCAGFSLVEVMIASLVLLIVSSGIVLGLVAALKTQDSAANHYRATCIGRNRIQEAKAVSFNSLSLLGETNTIVDGNGILCATGTYRRTTIIATNLTGVSATMTVKVLFEMRAGQLSKEPIQIQTFISNKM